MYLLMTDAVQTTSVYKIKDIEIILEVGQGAASDMELAEYSCYNHKTIGKLIDSFLTGSIYRSPEPTVTLMNDIPLETVLKMLGHKYTTTTQIYVKVTNQMIGNAISRIENQIGERSQFPTLMKESDS